MKKSGWVKLVIVVAVAVGVGWGLKACGVDLAHVSPERIQAFVLSFGVWAPLVYLAGYGQPIIPLPASIMMAAAGLAFGTAWGMAAAMAASMIRACSAFLIARRLGRDVVAKLLKGPVAELDRSISKHGVIAVILIRLISGLPFDAQNYGLGLTQVRFGPYLLGTLLGTSPVCFAFVFFGHSLTDPRHFSAMLLVTGLVVGLIAAASAWRKRRPATGKNA